MQNATGTNARLYASTPYPEQKRELADEYFRFTRKNALESVKDEFFSHQKEGITDCVDAFFSNEVYDYLAPVRDEPMMQDDAEWQSLMQRMLVDEYRAIIERGNNAFQQLLSEGGYSTDQTIALLTELPMEQWHSRIKMILEQKNV